MTSSDPYVLGRSDAETRRLILQDQIYGSGTRRFFQAAGIGLGMKVPDIGSGAGDVALLLADLVGPRGRVIGVDMNAAIVETARARVEAAGWGNVRFLAGDVRKIDLDSDFDAVVGRWILMCLPDPASMLRSLAARLRVGGIVAFQENDFSYPPTVFPATELSRQSARRGYKCCRSCSGPGRGSVAEEGRRRGRTTAHRPRPPRPAPFRLRAPELLHEAEPRPSRIGAQRSR